MFDNVLQKSRIIPSIAMLFESASDLFEMPRVQGRSRDASCECRGTGWLHVNSYHADTGEEYDSVKPCHRSPRPGLKSSGRGPGGWLSECESIPATFPQEGRRAG